MSTLRRPRPPCPPRRWPVRHNPKSPFSCVFINTAAPHSVTSWPTNFHLFACVVIDETLLPAMSHDLCYRDPVWYICSLIGRLTSLMTTLSSLLGHTFAYFERSISSVTNHLSRYVLEDPPVLRGTRSRCASSLVDRWVTSHCPFLYC